MRRCHFSTRNKCRIRKFSSLVLAALMTKTALANPQGGTVVHGNISMSNQGNTLNINQSTHKGIVDWQSFNIGANETTNINMPSASSVSLHRVTGNNLSQIHGALNSNGTVMLVNPSGIIFGAGSRVDVGSLIATTGQINNQDFINGNYQFHIGEDNTGGIYNYGTITVADQGLAALVAPTVENHGLIQANMGHVALGSGITTVDLYGDDLIHFAVAEGTTSNLSNTGEIYAEAGRVTLSVKTIKNTVNNVINVKGVVRANSAYVSGGTIVLGSGSTIVGRKKVVVFADRNLTSKGTIESEPMGFIETSAKLNADVFDTNIILGAGGTWLIDPNDITINDATTIVGLLDSGVNVILNTATSCPGVGEVCGAGLGDITINTFISWVGTGSLSLLAENDIYLNDSIISNVAGEGVGNIILHSDYDGDGFGSVYFAGTVATANAGDVSVYYNALGGYGAPEDFVGAGNIFSTNGRAIDYMLVHNVTDLQNMSLNINGAGANYALSQDIDATATVGWNAGAGFAPIGNIATTFTGHFDGQGYTIDGLTINRPGTDYIGLFGYAYNSLVPINTTVKNVNFTNVNLTGARYVGALLGTAREVDISNITVNGVIVGTDYVGGLIGLGWDSNAETVSNAATIGTFGVSRYTGGLMGEAYIATIDNSYNTGNISGRSSVGGLVGESSNTVFINSYNTGDVTGDNWDIGGISGYASSVSISDLYNTGNITSTGSGGEVGGIIGYAANILSDVTNVYNTGNVSGADSWVGGVFGDSYTTSSITVSNVYNTGNVTNTLLGASDTGGVFGSFRGDNFNTVFNNVYNTGVVSSQGSRTGGVVGDLWRTASLVDVYNTGQVSGSGTGVGGVIGYNDTSTDVVGVYNTGAVSGAVTSSYVGGLIGYANAAQSISNSYNTGNITNPGDYTGGIVARIANGGSLTNSYNTGTVNGANAGASAYTGGLVGNSAGNTLFVGVFNSGDVIGDTDTGGIVGHMESNTVTLAAAVNMGNVTGTTNVGGIIGLDQSNSYTFEQNYNAGRITGTEGVGGLIGTIEHFSPGVYILRDSYNHGAVDGSALGTIYVGGLVGTAMNGSTMQIYDNYNAGWVIGDGIGTTGGAFGALSSCDLACVGSNYFDSTTSGIGIGIGTEDVPYSVSDVALAPYAQGSYAAFDFGGTWATNGSAHPYLSNLFPGFGTQVSGTVVGAADQHTINIVADGRLVGRASLFANGTFNTLLPQANIAAPLMQMAPAHGEALIIFTSPTDTVNASSIAFNDATNPASLQNLSLQSGRINITTAGINGSFNGIVAAGGFSLNPVLNGTTFTFNTGPDVFSADLNTDVYISGSGITMPEMGFAGSGVLNVDVTGTANFGNIYMDQVNVMLNNSGTVNFTGELGNALLPLTAVNISEGLVSTTSAANITANTVTLTDVLSLNLSSDITVSDIGGFVLNAPTLLSDDVTISAPSITIDASIDTLAGTPTLVLNSTVGNTTVNSEIGTFGPLSNITFNGPGVTQLGGDIFANGNTILFNTPVNLIADVQLLDDNGGITFTGAVTDDGFGRNLTLVMNNTAQLTLGGDLGTSANPLGTLTIFGRNNNTIPSVIHVAAFNIGGNFNGDYTGSIAGDVGAGAAAAMNAFGGTGIFSFNGCPAGGCAVPAPAPSPAPAPETTNTNNTTLAQTTNPSALKPEVTKEAFLVQDHGEVLSLQGETQALVDISQFIEATSATGDIGLGEVSGGGVTTTMPIVTPAATVSPKVEINAGSETKTSPAAGASPNKALEVDVEKQVEDEMKEEQLEDEQKEKQLEDEQKSESTGVSKCTSENKDDCEISVE